MEQLFEPGGAKLRESREKLKKPLEMLERLFSSLPNHRYWPTDDPSIRRTTQNKLNSNSSKQQPHDSSSNSNPRFSKPGKYPIAKPQHDPRYDHRSNNRRVDDDLGCDIVRLSSENHHSRHGSGAGQHRNPERSDSNIFLLLAFHQLFGSLLRAALRPEHVHRDEPEDESARNPECRQCDAEHLQYEIAGERENDQGYRGGNAGRSSCRLPPLIGLVPGEREISGHDRDRIHKKEDRRERDERELPDLAQCSAFEKKGIACDSILDRMRFM